MHSLTRYLLERIERVRADLDLEPVEVHAEDSRFGDLLDSMAMVEFLLCVAEDCGVAPEQLEACVRRTFGTVAELAAGMRKANIAPQAEARPYPVSRAGPAISGATTSCCLAATACRLPMEVETAASLDRRLHRPSVWLARHAGIRQRRVWREEDPVAAAVEVVNGCLTKAKIGRDDVGGLLVTSEAPPRLAGLAALLHHRLGLPGDAIAIEIGNACTGFLTALWTARQLALPRLHCIVLALEAPTRYLQVRPGAAGEAAALFGDAAVACLLSDQVSRENSAVLKDVVLHVAGGASDLVTLRAAGANVEILLEGRTLASRAIEAMASVIHDLTRKHGLSPSDLKALAIHGGNARFPALLARRLKLPAERILSATASTGNLGSASLPVAWARRPEVGAGPVIWAAAGAGLHWGAALWELK